MIRDDGRSVEELRPITLVYERLDRVDGSARFGFGQTQAVASVSGPIEVRANLESPSQATLDIHIRPLASVPGTDSRAFATILKTVLSPSLYLSHHPRTLVQLVGQALCGSESGSGSGTVGRGWNSAIMASLINACSAAFINAGSMPMRGVVCAVSIGRLPGEDDDATILVLDPSETELSKLRGGGCFAFLFSFSTSPSQAEDDIPGVSLLWRNYAASDGTFDEAEFARAQSLACQGATEIWKTMKKSLEGNIDGLLNKTQTAKPPPGVPIHVDEDDDEKMEI
ncbi:ribosomal protein S5 domain 2-type protein [Irpex rosettiformis]|uniref:Ribosomal protein S5 domain 2-type protein n=1 Tax=Irpex rosettiformis TaxID=378272 RepID=A0ACB8U821_9APHY|nr:ribosomal protein S5 domain 2-type protein [Irpex rosettiformis]